MCGAEQKMMILMEFDHNQARWSRIDLSRSTDWEIQDI